MSKSTDIQNNHLLDENLKFEDMEIDSRILRALSKLGYHHPTLVQSKAIPLALSGKDIVARARTGSGKTSAYCIPILQKLLMNSKIGIKALFIVPTKELAEQVTEHLRQLIFYCSKEFKVTNIIQTKLEMNCQLEQNHLLVGTPSKFLLAMEQFNVKETLEFLVVDEADLVLSYGYEEDIKKLLQYLPQMYQSFLMSATLTDKVTQLKSSIVKKPAILKLEDGQEDDLLKQYVLRCTEKDRYLFLFFILKLKLHPFGDAKTIVFVNTAEQCYRVKLFLEQFGIRSCALNSELPLKSRHHIVQEFNNGLYDTIIATDDSHEQGKEIDSEEEDEKEVTQNTNGKDENIEDGLQKSQRNKKDNLRSKKKKTKKTFKQDSEFGVSRGIDFKNVQSVINFDLPLSTKSYNHRVGRTARGVGNEGFALSFVQIHGPKENKTSVMTFDEIIFKRIEKRQIANGREILKFEFDMSKIEGFRYRVEDASRAVTKVAIKEARVKELKSEILTSEKLKAHFEDNPKDLEALKHDKPLHPARVQSHLKHIPTYLLPKKRGFVQTEANGDQIGNVRFHQSDSRRKRRIALKKQQQYQTGQKKMKLDPLKTFK